MISSQTAPFKVVICGAGIAGLCAGIGLAKQGHSVTILESAQELAAVGIGIHIPPNATLVLRHFGILEKFSENAIHPTSFVFRRWADGSVIGKVPVRRPAQDDFAPYWSIRRSDYQRHLYEAAVEAGCQVRLGARVEALNEDLPSVALAGGEILHAHLIVVADGIKSKLRGFVIPEEEVSMVINPLSTYRAYLDKADLLSDPITAPVFQETATNVWAGYGRHVIVYPCGGNVFTLGATHPAKELEAMEWNRSASPEQAQEEYRDWNPVVSRVLFHAKDVKRWRLAEVPRLPRWTSKSGKVVLMGDTAHGMVQFLAQGAAMATEDAAALAECVDRAKSSSHIPAVLRAYERSRKWRCEIVQAQSRRNGDMLHMPDGEEQENRDRKMAALAQTGMWEADAGPMIDAAFLKFLYGHNVVQHTRKILDSLKL